MRNDDEIKKKNKYHEQVMKIQQNGSEYQMGIVF